MNHKTVGWSKGNFCNYIVYRMVYKISHPIRLKFFFCVFSCLNGILVSYLYQHLSSICIFIKWKWKCYHDKYIKKPFELIVRLLKKRVKGSGTIMLRNFFNMYELFFEKKTIFNHILKGLFKCYIHNYYIIRT